jgi:hypothetical protein
VRPPKLNGSRHRPRPHRTRGARGSGRELAIVVHGGVVQGVYANRCRPLTVYLLDYDDLRADDGLAEQVRRTGEFPHVTVEAGTGTRGRRVSRHRHPPGTGSAGGDEDIAHGPMQTVTIARCPYVVLVTPFQDRAS